MDEQELTYRSLSSTAVIGLVLAVLSSLAFFWPTLWPLTLVALVASWSAARSIAKNSDTLAGIRLAQIGMFLAVAVGIGSYARTAIVQNLHEADADIVAEKFLELVTQENLVAAKELMIPYAQRQPTAEHTKIHYESDIQAIEALDALKSKEAIQRLEGMDKAKIHLVEKNQTVLSRYGRYATSRVYEIESNQSDQATDSSKRQILMILERSSKLAAAPVAWYVKEVRMPGSNR